MSDLKADRAGMRPKIRTAHLNGQLLVAHGYSAPGCPNVIAVLEKDSLFGWYWTWQGAAFEALGQTDGEMGYDSRTGQRDCLDACVRSYTSAWKEGRV